MTAILRTSERKAHSLCPEAWWWGWREGLVSRSSARDALWFGTGVHIALAKWYCGPGAKRGPEPAETWDAYAADSMRSMRVDKTMDERTEKEWVDLRELGGIMLAGYIEKYGLDEHKLVIASEQQFDIDIPWPKWQDLYDVPPDDVMVRFAGTFDSAWRHADTGFIFLDEHKTYGSSSIVKQLAMDTQFGGYWAISDRVLKARGLINEKDRVRGIEYNGLRKAKPDERPKNAQGYACNKPVKADYIAAIEGERALLPSPGPAGSWVGPPLTGKESLALLGDIASKLGLIVLGEQSKVQSPPLFVREMVVRTSKERGTQLIHIQNEAYEMRLRRDKVIPLRVSPGRHCGWCEFEGMCRLKQTGGNWKDFKEAQFAVRDPYSDHRKSTDDHG